MDLPADDMRRLETELGKLFDYMGDEVVIHASDVTEVLSRGPDEVIFKLCDALGARRGGEALRLLDSTFHIGTKPDGTALRVLTMLARQIRLVHQARILLEYRMIGRGAAPMSAEVAAMLPADGIKATLANPRMAWMGDKLATQAKQWSFDALESALIALEHADGALKGIVPGGDNPREIIEECVVRMCA
jgi:DNA polymerase III delta subunit